MVGRTVLVRSMRVRILLPQLFCHLMGDASKRTHEVSELETIPGVRLSIPAARAWNAPGGPAAAGLRPSAYENSYRDLATQEEYWRLYQEGRGNLAAYPGTSNHGLGVAIDLANGWEQQWIYDHGAKFGWKKTEAFSEPWHFNFVGAVGPFPPTLRRPQEG